MSNEVLFIVWLFVCLTLPVIFSKGGKAWLFGYIGINGCMLVVLAPLTATTFGYAISVNTILWAPLYLCTDILTERYGKKAALQGALLSALVGYVVIALTQIPLSFTPAEESIAHAQKLMDVFQHSWRMVLTGSIIYFMCQVVDVHVYDYLHRKTGEKYLWLRNNASTLFTTFINNIAFWYFAFGHVLENWFATAIAGYLVTVVVALCDTPFIYMAKKIKPLDLKE